MPWGFGGYGYREPPPRRLTMEELLQEDFAPPPRRPAPITNLQGLSPEDRRGARLDAIWAALAAAGAGMSSGNLSAGALRGIGDVQEVGDRAIAGANARQEATYQEEMQQAASEAQRQKRRQEAAALFGMYEEVASGETPAFAAKAERAARAGSMAELEKLRESKPQRAAARAKGYDPDSWDTTQRLQEELAAEIKRQQAAKDWEEGERARLAEKEKIEAEAETAKRVAQNEKGVLWQARETPAEAAAKAEAIEKVRSRYQEGGASGPKGVIRQAADGAYYLMHYPDAQHPKPWAELVNGQPPASGKWRFETQRGVPYVVDMADPMAGAFEIPQKAPGDPGYDAGVERFRRKEQAGPAAVQPPRRQEAGGGGAAGPAALAGSLAAIEAAVGRSLPPNVRDEVLKDLKAGRKPRELVTEILRDNPQWRRK